MQAPFELIGTSAAIRSVQQELDYAARSDAAPPQGFWSLADKLRGALAPREK